MRSSILFPCLALVLLCVAASCQAGCPETITDEYAACNQKIVDLQKRNGPSKTAVIGAQIFRRRCPQDEISPYTLSLLQEEVCAQSQMWLKCYDMVVSYIDDKIIIKLARKMRDVQEVLNC